MTIPPPSRVLYVEQNTDGTVGGSYQCLYDLVRSLDRTRYTPIVVFYQDNRYARTLAALGVDVEIIPPPTPADRPSLARRLANAARHVAQRRRLIRRHRIDLVHLNNAPSVGAIDWLPAARLAGIPIITHARGVVTLGSGSPVERRLQNYYTRVIAISRHIAVATANDGIPAIRISQIYDGVDLEAFRRAAARQPDTMRAELGVPPDAIFAVMVGHLRPWKGQLEVLHAVAALDPAHRARLRLAIVGATAPAEAAYAQTVRETVRALGLTDTVKIFGERTDIPDLMRAADVVIHASTDPEPFGLVVVQGMAMGRLVIASALGGPAEVLTPDTGATFDPRRPSALPPLLRRAIDDPAWRQTLAANAVGRADAFSLARNVAAIEQLYAEVLPSAR
jgi:glycosyltransferase involved in cell wall biosynthesis